MTNSSPSSTDTRPRGSRWGRRRRSGERLSMLAVVAFVVVVGGGAWWWFFLRGSGESEIDTLLAPASAPPTVTRPTLDAPEPLDLPPLDESDGIVRDVVGALSRHPQWTAWLVTDALAERFVAAVASVAAGISPAAHVPFLKPEGKFQVMGASGAREIDPASYRRYDALTEAFVSFDTPAAIRLYQQLLPLFEDAHRALGFPEGSFGPTFAAAIDNVLAVQIPDAPPAVVLDVETYLYNDPGMEALTPADKHVLRLGPQNGRQVQAKLRELRAGLVAAGLVPR